MQVNRTDRGNEGCGACSVISGEPNEVIVQNHLT